jgi:hypothetical protein
MGIEPGPVRRAWPIDARITSTLQVFGTHIFRRAQSYSGPTLNCGGEGLASRDRARTLRPCRSCCRGSP